MGSLMLSKIYKRFLVSLALLFASAPAFAEETIGISYPKQLGFQPAASPVKHQMEQFHDLLLVIITVITIFVLLLLLYVIARYNAKANPKPSTTTHNTLLEIVWTAVPVLILLVIVVPSFKLLYFTDKTPEAAMTVKAIGKQWYWTYEYPDNGNFTFDSYMLTDEDAANQGKPRLLGADNYLVLPAETNIRFLVTAGDVLHAFAVPSLGIKRDAVPGRINETWARIEKPGIYYGQCSELCGARHGFMPIAIHALPKAEYDAWVKEAQGKFPKAESAEIEQPQASK